jgi:hypothetical protein
MTLNDFTKWEEVFIGSYQATRDQCGRRVAIPEIFLPIVNPTNTLLIGCFSQSASSSWSLAGWFHQIIDLPFKSSYGDEKKCLLNRYNLVSFPSEIGSFKTSFKPVYWLDDITLRVSIFKQ